MVWAKSRDLGMGDDRSTREKAAMILPTVLMRMRTCEDQSGHHWV